MRTEVLGFVRAVQATSMAACMGLSASSVATGLATGCLATACLTTGCDKKADPSPTKTSLSSAEASRIGSALSTYADLAHALYWDAHEEAKELSSVVEEFLENPTQEGLTRAQEAWLAARRPYQKTEVFRFYDGPIDRVELEVNTWPIDEAYVDAEGTQPPGIIQDVERYPQLTLQLLSALNGKDGETSISTGYHVVEFLLWGVDISPTGPGRRPVDDFIGKEGSVPSRRRQFLRLAIENLLRNLRQVRDAWAPGVEGNYRGEFLARDPESALMLVLKGMGTLSGAELAGERLTVAYETKYQENEHSCFSDSTVADLVGNGLGILDVCQGKYHRQSAADVDGTGICDAILERDAGLARRLESEIEASVSALRAIPEPFDQAILGSDSAPGRRSIWRAIQALEKQAGTLTEIANEYSSSR